MSEHRAELIWKQGDKGFAPPTFCRNHTVKFTTSAQEIRASAAPEFKGDAACVDPETMLTGALASCHMLTFLFLCARETLTVETYEDHAVGFLERNPERQFAMTRIELHPRVQFAAGITVPREKLEALHHQAHAGCFIANSIKAAVTVLLDS